MIFLLVRLFSACDCFQFGSLTNDVIAQCDVNGQCPCHSHVVGLQCERCQEGYWNIVSGNGIKRTCMSDKCRNVVFISFALGGLTLVFILDVPCEYVRKILKL